MNPWQDFVDQITGPWGWLLIISTLACLGFVGMTVSHFVKCLITKNTTSLSKQFVIILPITNTFILIYNSILFSIFFINNVFNWGMLLPIIINGLISGYATMFLKIRYCRKAAKLGLTEIQYFEKYLKPKSLAYKRSQKEI